MASDDVADDDELAVKDEARRLVARVASVAASVVASVDESDVVASPDEGALASPRRIKTKLQNDGPPPPHDDAKT